MANIAEELAIVLGAIERPGDFATSGTVDFGLPILHVEGVGQISLPLLPAQAELIIAEAGLAPFGRGEQTVFDTDVRRTWQLGPDKVKIGGKGWSRVLDSIVAAIPEGLGVSAPVEAQFYKLLMYDKGGFFLAHRDTEKASGMFATLVIVLPGESEGGELVIRHDGREKVFDLRRADPGELGYAAFYADCVHEVRPVTSGYRLALTYNLIRKDDGIAPTAPDYGQEKNAIVALLSAWGSLLAEQAPAIDRIEQRDEELEWDEEEGGGAEEDDEDEDEDEDEDVPPRKLVYPLRHAYTPAELTFSALKGADAAVAGVLRNAALAAGFDLHLALLTVEESGWAEYAGYSRYSEDRFQAGDVEVDNYHLSHWRGDSDKVAPFHEIPVLINEVSPPDYFEEAAPDDEEFHEATGNEGVSFERSYRRAALVLWPSGTALDIASGAGIEAALFYLEDRSRRALAEGDSAACAEALQMADRVIAGWRSRAGSTQAARLLAALRQIGEAGILARALYGVVAGGSYDREIVPEVLASLEALPRPGRVQALEEIIVRSAEKRLGSLAGLLAAWSKSFGVFPAEIMPALRTLVAGLPTARPPYAGLYEKVDVTCVVDLVTALAAADGEMASTAVEHMLEHPGYYQFDGLLVPATKQLVEGLSEHPAVRSLAQACREHLDKRIAEQLAPPPDWRRAVSIKCNCEHCRRLKAFMADPSEETWTLRARQEIRTHVEDQIRNASCDLDCSTLRKGSPHALICRKNLASYERRVKQREQDMIDRASLGTNEAHP